MASPGSPDPSARQRRVFRVIWGAFLACPVFYGVVGYFTRVDNGNDLVVLALSLAAAVIFAMSFVIKRLLFENALVRDREDRLEGRGKFPDRLTGVMIVVWVLTESIGVFGLAARFVGADVKTMVGFIGLALAGLLIHRPPNEQQIAP